MSLGLYRTTKSNFIPYYANGNGRDRYILFDNAGFFHNFRKTLSPSNIYRTGTIFSSRIIQHNKDQSIKSPNFHYHSDGQGRDKYISVNGGGLYSDPKPLISFKLIDFLRKNEKYSMPKIKKGRICLSKAEVNYIRYLKEKEKRVIKRLYENEKKKFMKKNKTDFLSFDNKNNENRDNENKKDKNLTARNTKNCKNMNRILPYKIKSLNNIQPNEIKNKNDLLISSFSARTQKDYFSDIKKISRYKELQSLKKKLSKLKNMPYFHILNDHSIDK